jgi:hypothetical protein
MAINTQSARIKNHTSTTAGSFTVPASEDFTDGSWDKWDLAKSEFGVNESSDKLFVRIDSAIKEVALTESLVQNEAIACSDMTTALTVAGDKAYFRAPAALTITEVRASVFTAPTGADLIVDIHLNGTTIMTTNKLEIDATEKTSETAATAPVLTTTAVADDDIITIDVDQIGSTIAGAGLIVRIYYTI